MNSYSTDTEALDSVDDKTKGVTHSPTTSGSTSRCFANCNKFQQPRLDKIQKYRDLCGRHERLSAEDLYRSHLSVEITKEPAE